MTTVDIVVPCYNYARYLGQCVESVLSQQKVSVRVLIIDDCSTDNSAEVGFEPGAHPPDREIPPSPHQYGPHCHL
ncbi:glycosyltransferase family A protein [Devosia algicola]|uniref:Glycosyltransferase family A protein n=1 Tax=Devosia algicola TaxID=3026418 RepID=A0ABY7YPI8_9HYPH|nr:glycosyltransferase family A protein [Devosia algicola]WDR02949.1 glycosyltransferase family A protein [Devosia algicola]